MNQGGANNPMIWNLATLLNPAKSVHLSLDIETTSTGSNAGVWQIAVASIDETLCFNMSSNPTTITGSERLDANTLTWQQANNQENWSKAHYSKLTEKDLAQQFLAYLAQVNSTAAAFEVDIYWWAKGKDFDFPILRNLLNLHLKTDKFNPNDIISKAMHYRNLHELRTLDLLTGTTPSYPPKGGHDAMVDAEYQLTMVLQGLEKLRSNLRG